MKKSIHALIILLVLVVCSCDKKNKGEFEDSNVKYPSSFPAIQVTQNIGCIKFPGKDSFCVFDSKECKVLGIYSFENFCRFSYATLVDQDVYVAAYTNEGDSQERAILRVSLATGKVSSLPFYNRYAGRFALVDGRIWIDTTAVVPPDEHKIEVFNPASGSISTINVPWMFIDKGISINSLQYMTVLYNGSVMILNRTSGKLTGISNLFDMSFSEKTVSGSFMPMCNQTNCFVIRGNLAKSNVHRSILYHIKSFEPLSYKKIFMLPDTEEFGPVAELSDSIFLVSRLKDGTGKLIIRKFNSNNFQLTAHTMVSGAHPSTIKGYNALWLMSYPVENHHNLLRVDPGDLSVQIYPVD